MRLTMAALVIYSHAWIVGGWGDDPIGRATRVQESFGGLAVVGFFTISGYLVAKSADQNDILQFLWHRVLRIFPGFWTVLIVSALVVGPFVWHLRGILPFWDYFTQTGQGPFTYITHNLDLVMRQTEIGHLFSPSVPGFAGRSHVDSVNASLWTLVYEWRCYLFLAVLCVFGVVKRLRIAIVAIAAVLALALLSGAFPAGSSSNLLPFMDAKFVKLAYAFACGSALYAYSDRLTLERRYGVLAWVAVIATLLGGGWLVIGIPAFAYALMWTSAALPGVFRTINAKNDYSYGVYVYGFVVQQTTVALGWNSWGLVPWLLACLAITGGCAWLSWHIVEKNAMKLRHWGPGRGLDHWRGRVAGWVRRSTSAPPLAR
nr:acyltransferase [Galbitalea soli]